MRMEILENIVAAAVRWLMSLMGTDDMWFIASVVAIALVVLLLLAILLLVLLVRTRGKLKKRAVQIDELQSQVMGLQALTQLAGGKLSEDGDSVVYVAPEAGQQIHYDEFFQESGSTSMADEEAASRAGFGHGAEASDDPLSWAGEWEESRSRSISYAAARDDEASERADGLALPSWLAAAATKDDAELQEKHVATVLGDDTADIGLDEETRERLKAMLAGKGAGGEEALRPPSVDQIRHSREDADSGCVEEGQAAEQDVQQASAVSAQDAHDDGDAVPSAESSFDHEVDAILNSIKHKSEQNLKQRHS